MRKKRFIFSVLGLFLFLTSIVQAQEEMIVGFSSSDLYHTLTESTYDKLLYLNFTIPTDKAYDLTEIGVNIYAFSPAGNVKLAIYNDSGLLFETPEIAVTGNIAEYVSYSIPQNTLLLTASAKYQIAIIGSSGVKIDAQANAINEGTGTSMSSSSYGIYKNNTINYPIFPTEALIQDIIWYRAVSVVLKGNLAPVLPTIANQPAQADVCLGENTTFTVSGYNIDTYQWQLNTGSGFGNITNGGIYSNATTNTLNIAGVTESMNNYQYRCYLTNTLGNHTSDMALLTVDTEDPVIACLENQNVNLTQGSTEYTVSGTEFAPSSFTDNIQIDSIYNDYNEADTLKGEIFPIGTTTVKWIAVDNCGNRDTCVFDVQINAYAGIETLEKSGISIFPNPTNGIFEIKSVEFKINNIEIFDLAGKIILSSSDKSLNSKYDLSSFENGIYILKIQTDNQILTTKIVKE